MNDIYVCPNCFSKDLSVDKSLLPGSIEITFSFTYLCNDCGTRTQTPLIVKESEYDELKKEFDSKS